MDQESIGYVMQPEEIGCKRDSRDSSGNEKKACTNHTTKAPLNPTTLLVGCHKTSTNNEMTGYASGAFDELAIWTRRLSDEDKELFLGGYKSSFTELGAAQTLALMLGIDLNDVNQAERAISVVNDVVAGKEEGDGVGIIS